MTPADLDLVERFVLRPESLAPEERGRVERLLATDAAARAWADELRGFYTEVRRTAPGEGADARRRFLDALFADERPEDDAHPEGGTQPEAPLVRVLRAVDRPAPTVRLAADTGRFETLGTLAASDGGVRLRLVYDRAAATCRGYVLADAEADRAFVALSGAPLPGLLVTDAAGRLAFACDAAGAARLQRPVVHLHRPLWTATVDPDAAARLQQGTPLTLGKERAPAVLTAAPVSNPSAPGAVRLRLRPPEPDRSVPGWVVVADDAGALAVISVAGDAYADVGPPPWTVRAYPSATAPADPSAPANDPASGA